MERLNGDLKIGAIVFPQMDQMDFTGSFEVLSDLHQRSYLSALRSALRLIYLGTAFLPDDLSKARASKDHGLWGHLSYLRAFLAAS
jgi:hypothetical protein